MADRLAFVDWHFWTECRRQKTLTRKSRETGQKRRHKTAAKCR
jgi:hypothetical protein